VAPAKSVALAADLSRKERKKQQYIEDSKKRIIKSSKEEAAAVAKEQKAEEETKVAAPVAHEKAESSGDEGDEVLGVSDEIRLKTLQGKAK